MPISFSAPTSPKTRYIDRIQTHVARLVLRCGQRSGTMHGVVEAAGTYTTHVGTQILNVPIVPIVDDLAIALLITVDHGVQFCAQAGAEIAELLRPLNVDIVASVATMGIPIAIEVTRALGLDDYLILQKTPKIHLADAISEPVRSITTGSAQTLLFDRERVSAVKGRRVALVDDVVSTGASVRAALNLLRHVGAEPVAVAALLTEASEWRTTLGVDAQLVRTLGALPIFHRNGAGEFIPDWGEEVPQTAPGTAV